jgi:hypothetical protein
LWRSVLAACGAGIVRGRILATAAMLQISLVASRLAAVLTDIAVILVKLSAILISIALPTSKQCACYDKNAQP